MRVYEYAKKHNVPSKDVVVFLQERGFAIQSHMAVVPDDAFDVLQKRFEAVEKKAEVSVQQEDKKYSKELPDKTLQVSPAHDKIEKKPMIQQDSLEASAQKLASKSKQASGFKAPKKTQVEVAAVKPNPIEDGIVAEAMTVSDFANLTQKPVAEVILTLLKKGVVAAKNQIINEKVVTDLAHHYGLKIRIKEASVRQPEKFILEGEAHQEERVPIVVVIGHVDHGKTTLLDFIRSTRVAAKERGGITQHLGAYKVETSHGSLVFLDTPGHAAFTKIRERGTGVADIAILVVAADDGIMPQTKEAIRQAQAANIPLVVAINKIDKASPSQVEAVKKGLTQFGLVPEDWGGQTICVPISAKLGTGISDLLDIIVLQSKLMELVTSVDVPARGYVLEAKIEKGRGPVATVLLKQGILRVGSYFVAGSRSGKVSSMVDSNGVRVLEAHPSQPVLVAGFDALPQAGDLFEVVLKEDRKKPRAEESVSGHSPKGRGSEKGINMIFKVDNDSTREALVDAIYKINEKAYEPIHLVAAQIGNVSESDVQLARDTDSLIYTLHSKTDPGAMQLALKYNIPIKQHDIIYKLLEELESLSESGRPIKMVLKKTGEASILKVFDIKGLGVIAGAQVRSGKLIKDGKVIIFRGKHKVGEGVVKSLQREKKTIKEALAGFECAFMVDGFNSWEVDDRVECFQEVPAA